MNRAFLSALGVAIVACTAQVRADTFGSGASSFTIEFVTIGQPNNPPDTTGSPNPAGSVPYAYRIGKYEISRDMVEKASAAGALGITLADMTLFGGNGPNKPATGVSWFEAARFVNWLNTSTGSAPAYKFDANGDFQLWQPGDPGYNPSNLFRNSLAKYFLPSVHEWYKAAFYDPVAGVYWNYPTGSNSPPVAVASGTASGTAVVMQSSGTGPADIFQAGGLSPFGTKAQGGNVAEWEETALDLVNDSASEMRGARGANWPSFASSLSSSNRAGTQSNNEGPGLGFRVATLIPEPTTAAIIEAAVLIALRWRRRRRAFRR
jgi:hypothetical protein